MDIPDLYKKLLDEPAYRKLLESMQDSDEKEKINAIMKKFLDDFQTKVFSPLGTIMDDKTRSKNLRDALLKKTGKGSISSNDDIDITKIIRDTSGK